MIKKLLAMTVITTMIISLVGCDTGKTISVSPDELASKLVSGVTFKDQLAKVEEDTVLDLYGLSQSQISDMSVYMGSGATAEEVAVFQTNDTEAVKKSAQQRIKNKKADFENYIPEEIPKLNDPVLQVKGDYVILCISDHNDQAEKVIDEVSK